MSDLPKCVYCGVRRTRSSLTITGDPEMHGGCRKLWKSDQESLNKSKSRRYKYDVCGLRGVQRGKGPTQKRHQWCRGEYARRRAQAHRLARPEPVAFIPATFDAAMVRGRTFYESGLAGSDYPDTHLFLVSPADRASYALGQRHAKEFPR